MRIRRLPAALAVACTLALITSAPAAAKGGGMEIRSLTITGPGLDKPIVRKATDETLMADLFALAEQTGLLRAIEAAPGNGIRPPAAIAPDVDLGPGYVLIWRLRDERGGRLRTVRQTAYPYASRGGWVSTRRGQAVGAGRETAGGWTGGYYSTSLRSALVAYGLPKASPVPVTPWSAPAPAALATEPSGGWVPPATLAVALLLGVGLVVLAARRRSGRGGERVAATH